MSIINIKEECELKKLMEAYRVVLKSQQINITDNHDVYIYVYMSTCMSI